MKKVVLCSFFCVLLSVLLTHVSGYVYADDYDYCDVHQCTPLPSGQHLYFYENTWDVNWSGIWNDLNPAELYPLSFVNVRTMANTQKFWNPTQTDAIEPDNATFGMYFWTTAHFTGPVDIYSVLYVPGIDPDNLYLFSDEYGFTALSDGLHPWRTNTVTPNDGNPDTVFEGLKLDYYTPRDLPAGDYYLYTVVAPAGTTSFDNFYAWGTSFTNPLCKMFGDCDQVLLPESGLKMCYNSSSNSYTFNCEKGQDAEVLQGVTWPKPRFKDNGDGTMTDRLTGLMWLKDLYCFEGQRTWYQLMGDVKDFNKTPEKHHCKEYTAKYNDWRVPNINEMMSIAVEHVGTAWEGNNLYKWNNPYKQGINPLTDFGFLGHNNVNWESSTYLTSTDAAAYGQPSNGTGIQTIGAYGDIFYSSDKAYIPSPDQDPNRVLPVRGTSTGPVKLWKTGQTTCYPLDEKTVGTVDCKGTGEDGEYQMGVEWPNPRFVNNGDGTVTDRLTGLMWLRDANCMATHYPKFDMISQPERDLFEQPEDGFVSFDLGLDFIQGINNGTFPKCAAGYSDWHLPNRVELFSLLNFSDQDFTEVQLSQYSFINEFDLIFSNVFGAGPYDSYHGYEGYTNGIYMSSSISSYDMATGVGEGEPAKVWPVRIINPNRYKVFGFWEPY